MRDYFKKMFALIRKHHIIFRKLVRKYFVKLHWQTRHFFNKFFKIMWKHDKQMKIELHTSKCQLQRSALLWFYCKWTNAASLFLPLAIIFPVLTHWFSIAPPDARIPARKTLFQQQYLKRPSEWTTLSIWDGVFCKSCRHGFHHVPEHQKGANDQSTLVIGFACCFILQD